MPRSTTQVPTAPVITYRSTQWGADKLAVSVDTIRRRIADGSLPAYRVGGQLRLRDADLDKLAVRVLTVGGQS